LTNHTLKTPKQQLNRNVKSALKQQLKMNGESSKFPKKSILKNTKKNPFFLNLKRTCYQIQTSNSYLFNPD